MDIERVIREVEDRLFVRLNLDAWERALYWHLFRHTRLDGRPSVLIGLDTLSRQTAISTTKLRETIRSMERKGCLSIEERTRDGHVLKVVLPAEIPGFLVSPEPEPVDLEQIDFFAARRYLQPLMERQEGRCFYCLRVLTAESSALDHLVPQVAGGGNSYRNIVVACHECNARKQALIAEDYLRMLYRDGLLGQSDLKERLEMLSQVAAGSIVPVIAGTAQPCAAPNGGPATPSGNSRVAEGPPSVS